MVTADLGRMPDQCEPRSGRDSIRMVHDKEMRDGARCFRMHGWTDAPACDKLMPSRYVSTGFMMVRDG